MPVFRWFFVFVLGLGVAGAQPAVSPVIATGDPAKPWTYWWWMGSAVNEADLTRQLEAFAKAGLGGVHVIPIYGAKGYEAQFRPFLGTHWLAAFGHTVREARRLGLGVDLTTGTGWPFGGPNVTAEMAAKRWKLVNGQLVAEPTRQQVKRPAPGGEGPVLDPFDGAALRRYLTRFDSTLAQLPERPRAVYNDSYEAFGANFTNRFLDEFRKRRGYDLNEQLAPFLDTTGTETGVRVRQDYHETLAELLRHEFTNTWTGWARRRGYLTRNQAHGSPGNLLDLYAGADIPETESFGSSRFPIPGLRVDENYEVDRFGTPNPLAMKFASSAAHLTGKRLVSSETGTWLADHFKVSLSQLKPQIDELFAAGINHVFFHGTTYSPAAEPWPGWLFYASTHYGPSSHFFPHLPLLTGYVERCQRRLQASVPDHDVLVYFPMHDLWAQPAKSSGGLHQLEVHHVDRWLLKLPFGKLGERLTKAGFAFDYVSDALLDSLRGTGTHRIVLVPEARYLPEATARRLLELAKQGVRVIFAGSVPEQVPGFFEHQKRSESLRQLGTELRRQPSVVVAPAALEAALAEAGARPERWAEATGLSFLRKKTAAGVPEYFVTNLTARRQSAVVPVPAGWGSVRRYDPLHNRSEVLAGRNGTVALALEPGESAFLSFSKAAASTPAARRYPADTLTLTGTWQLDFPAGEPVRPVPQTLTSLRSWVLPGDTATGWFSGTGRYRLRVEVPAEFLKKKLVTLDLGDVREVAEVRLNGRDLGTAWCLPFRLTVPAGVLRAENELEIRVTNLSANRARYLDAKRVPWKKFYDINLVDIRYRPFDASRWEPVPSGLLGPVRLLGWH
jgi:hypothetical protein